MRCAILLLLALAALPGAEPPPFRVVIREVAYSQRIEYVLGDGEHPFADEDQRRVQLQLACLASGRCALLGWGAFAITAAVSDHGEDMAIAGIEAEGVFTSRHEFRDDPEAVLPGIPLPLTRLACAGLSRLEGSVELRFSREKPAVLRLAIADLVAGQERPLPGVDGASFVIVDVPGADGRLQATFNAAAHLALDDLVCVDAKGAEVPGRNRRFDWRDNLARLSFVAKPAPAAIEVRYYRGIEHAIVPIGLGSVPLGVALPGREDLRGPTRSGADGF